MESLRRIRVILFPFVKSLLAKLAYVLLILLLFYLMINQFKYANLFPIKRVSIYGVKHIDPIETRAALLPLVNRGFFNINVDLIRDELMNKPWMSNIAVRRVWPDQVIITLTEKTPIAFWNDKNLLSERGELFIPDMKSNQIQGLPKLYGPLGKHIVMLEYFTQINRLLMPLHAKISQLELSSYLTLKLKLDNGIQVELGHKDILTRLMRFVKVYPKVIGNRVNEVEYIDLRYPNGIAVKWKGIA